MSGKAELDIRHINQGESWLSVLTGFEASTFSVEIKDKVDSGSLT